MRYPPTLYRYGFGLISVIVLYCMLAITPLQAAPQSAQDIKYAKSAMTAVQAKKAQPLRRSIKKIHDPLLGKLMRWFLYTEIQNGASFQEISTFIKDNGGWPRMDTLLANAENAMKPSMSARDVLRWFEAYPPLTTQGQVRFAAALLKLERRDEAVTMLRRAWVEGKFNKSQEKQFYKLYRRYLTKFDHEARLDRLLWEGRYWPSRRMFWKVNEDQRRLATARFQLRNMQGNVDAAIKAVPDGLKNHPGLIYERLRWRRIKNKDKSALELLINLPTDLPYAKKWYIEREILARRALKNGFITQAYRIVSNHGVSKASTAAYADAEWLSGWIAMRFLGEAEWGYRHFVNMVGNVRYPISLARGAYWAGRAASMLNQTEQAEQWYRSAAAHATTYYGQLAALQIDTRKNVMLPLSMPVKNIETITRFRAHELTRAAETLVAIDAADWLRSIIVKLQSVEDTVLWKTQTADFARSLGRPDLGIKVAKFAVREALGMISAGYPVLDLPPIPKKNRGVKLERALVLALIRQESAFYAQAHSGAGARGLMQLMPRTAKRVARQVGLKYSKSRLLSDGTYNLKIGQSYLSQMVKNFDGSYILALAAYNAGPSRAKRWVRLNGHPRDVDVDAIDWVELIPFSETRNYVQRILEGVQVYRALLSKTNVALQLDEDLVR